MTHINNPSNTGIPKFGNKKAAVKYMETLGYKFDEFLHSDQIASSYWLDFEATRIDITENMICFYTGANKNYTFVAYHLEGVHACDVCNHVLETFEFAETLLDPLRNKEGKRVCRLCYYKERYPDINVKTLEKAIEMGEFPDELQEVDECGFWDDHRGGTCDYCGGTFQDLFLTEIDEHGNAKHGCALCFEENGAGDLI